jgi:CDP-diacylglycerol--serine O-phosphatidyltransferase
VARVWRRRRSLDTPRPAGRRWARLRQSGSRATQAFVRVTRRRTQSGGTLGGGTQVVYPQPDRARRRIGYRREVQPPTSRVADIAPVSPAVVPTTRPVAIPGSTTIPLLPGERTLARRVQFAIANGFTVASLLMGMSAVFLAIHGELRLAALGILACVAFDGFDGGLARKFGVASPFGAQMDSLADLSSFGVATGIVAFQWLVAQGANPLLSGLACGLLAVCAAIRLARFNVSPKNGSYFCGVPTTMTAAVLALNMLLGPALPAQVQVGVVAVYAVAMVTSFPYAKLISVLRLPMWLWVFPAICAMISVPATFAAVVGGYLASGPLLWMFSHRRTAAA